MEKKWKKKMKEGAAFTLTNKPARSEGRKDRSQLGTATGSGTAGVPISETGIVTHQREYTLKARLGLSVIHFSKKKKKKFLKNKIN